MNRYDSAELERTETWICQLEMNLSQQLRAKDLYSRFDLDIEGFDERLERLQSQIHVLLAWRRALLRHWQ